MSDRELQFPVGAVLTPPPIPSLTPPPIPSSTLLLTPPPIPSSVSKIPVLKPYYQHEGITIYHGDCREILPTLSKVDLVLTDPPYGIALEEHGRSGYDWTIVGDEDQTTGGQALIVCDAKSWPLVVFASPKKPWRCIEKWRQWLVWDKGPTVGGGGDRATCWKFSWDLIQIKGTGILGGKRDEAVLRFHVTQRDYALHPNQKPVGLMRYLMQKALPGGGTILDPFMGSGTTLRAAKDLGRKAIGIEIERKYCDIAIRRLAQEVLPFVDVETSVQGSLSFDDGQSNCPTG